MSDLHWLLYPIGLLAVCLPPICNWLKWKWKHRHSPLEDER